MRCSVPGVQFCGLEALDGRLGALHLRMIQHTHVGTWHHGGLGPQQPCGWGRGSPVRTWAGGADAWWWGSTGGER